MEPDKALLNRAVKTILGFHPGDSKVPHPGVEDLDAAPAVLLCVVHRRIGISEKDLRLEDVSVYCDTNAGADADLVPVDVHGEHKRAEDPLRIPYDLGLVGKSVTQHEELVASEPGNRVVRSDHGAKALPNLDQDLIAYGVSKAVVDVLEVVYIDHQQCDKSSRSARASTACAVRSSSSVRLGRSVSAS